MFVQIYIRECLTGGFGILGESVTFFPLDSPCDVTVGTALRLSAVRHSAVGVASFTATPRSIAHGSRRVTDANIR